MSQQEQPDAYAPNPPPGGTESPPATGANDRLRRYFQSKGERLRRVEKWVTLVVLIVWFAALLTDCAMTLTHCEKPQHEGNIPLSDLMEKYGIHAALGIGILFHFGLLAVWGAVCWLIHFIARKKFTVTLRVVRLVPVYMFLLRDTAEHVYGVLSWL